MGSGGGGGAGAGGFATRGAGRGGAAGEAEGGGGGGITAAAAVCRAVSSWSLGRPHFLYFLPLPQGQGSLRPAFMEQFSGQGQVSRSWGPGLASPSEAVGADDLAAAHRAQGAPGAGVDAVLDELDRAVAERHVHAA